MSATLRLALEGHGREDLPPEAGHASLDLTRTVGWFTSVYPIVLDLTGASAPAWDGLPSSPSS